MGLVDPGRFAGMASHEHVHLPFTSIPLLPLQPFRSLLPFKLEFDIPFEKVDPEVLALLLGQDLVNPPRKRGKKKMATSRMTDDQKTYFTWLVLRNTTRIVARCRTTAQGTEIINRAYAKLRQLGGGYSTGKDSGIMRQDCINMLGRLLGVQLQVKPPMVLEEEDDDYSYLEPF